MNNVRSSPLKTPPKFICPVSKEPLIQAVILVPCADKVQQVVAEQKFGPRIEGWKVTSSELCPVCNKQTIVGYMDDPLTRGLAIEETWASVLNKFKDPIRRSRWDIAPSNNTIIQVQEELSYPDKRVA